MARLAALAAKLKTEEAIDLGLTLDDTPRAAVAAILREPRGAESAELFFIRRAELASDPWSGHIAFPGGRRSPSDASLLETAIRETREEVGIDLSSAELLVRLPDVPAFSRSRKGNLVVTPFVFATREAESIVLNAEVQATLWVPFTTLARGEGKTTFRLDYEGRTYDLPCIQLEPGQHRLWGMTYRILEMLIERAS
jgi:8-oxo-dGTP pyrophosphatase MutT (NUDIX family)